MKKSLIYSLSTFLTGLQDINTFELNAFCTIHHSGIKERLVQNNLVCPNNSDKDFEDIKKELELLMQYVV